MPDRDHRRDGCREGQPTGGYKCVRDDSLVLVAWACCICGRRTIPFTIDEACQMSRRTIEILKNTNYELDVYEIRLSTGSISYSLGLFRRDHLLSRLQHITFPEGPSAERLVEIATQAGHAFAEAQWPE